MLVGARRYSNLHARAMRLFRANDIYAASRLSAIALHYERQGLMAPAYARHFRLWLDVRISRATYNGGIVPEPYDVWSAPKVRR